MTNAHVASGAQRRPGRAAAEDADGSLTSALSPKMTSVPARIVGLTSELDLALLKVDMKPPALPLATYRTCARGRPSSRSKARSGCATLF